MRIAARRLSLAIAAFGGTAVARVGRAQSAPTSGDVDAVCFGFAFGAWSPPLDWRAAGHGERPDSTRLQHAPAGRDWAAEASSPRDTVLMLYPAWWPVGVMVAIPARRIVAGDTVTGRASALVADGRLRPPTAVVRAWRVPCGGRAGAAPPTAAPRADSAAAPRGGPPPDDKAARLRPAWRTAASDGE